MEEDLVAQPPHVQFRRISTISTPSCNDTGVRAVHRLVFFHYFFTLISLTGESDESEESKIRIVIGPTKINFPIRLSMSAMGWMFSTRLESLCTGVWVSLDSVTESKSIFLDLDMLL